MNTRRLRLAVASLAVALVFLLLDLFDVSFFLGQTRVAIYPVAFFALLGVVLLLRDLVARSGDGKRRTRPGA